MAMSAFCACELDLASAQNAAAALKLVATPGEF